MESILDLLTEGEAEWYMKASRYDGLDKEEIRRMKSRDNFIRTGGLAAERKKALKEATK